METHAKPEGQASQQLREAYSSILAGAERFRFALAQQLQAIVDVQQISLAFPIESRVKTWESIISKIERLRLHLDRAEDLHDLVGARVIVLFQRNSAKLCQAISEAFTILKQEDTAARLGDSQFGYSSVHFLARLPSGWRRIPSFAGLPDIAAEIQVRTVSQHTWAAASHLLQYKMEESVPLPIRRSIYRLSALLETVDLELERVLAGREQYRSGITHNVSEPLNADSLQQVLDADLPAQNKDVEDIYDILLPELHRFNVTQTDQLRGIISKHLNEVLQEDASRAKSVIQTPTMPERSKERAAKGAFFTHVGLVRGLMEREFGDAWEKYMLQVALTHMKEDDPNRKNFEQAISEIDARAKES